MIRVKPSIRSKMLFNINNFSRNLADAKPNYSFPVDTHLEKEKHVTSPTSKFTTATLDTSGSGDMLIGRTTTQQPTIFAEAEKQAGFLQPLSFDEVPGPRVLQAMAKIWSVIPIISTHLTASTVQYLLSAGSQLSWGSNIRLFRYLTDEYGPVVRLQGPIGGDVVILSRPEHASTVFENEGRYPIRSCLDCIEKYRLQYRKYRQAGPFLMYGPEWEKLRSSLEFPIQKSLNDQFMKIEDICEEFTKRIVRIRNKQDEVPKNFLQEINKWAIECLWTVMLNKKVGFLDLAGLSTMSEPARLLESLNAATDAIRKCEYGFHIWKFIETPAWRNLVKHCDSIDTIVNKYVRKAQASLREKKEKEGSIEKHDVSLLENLLVKDGMLPEDVMTVMLDMMLIGVNATSHTAAFLMYHLARYPRTQRILYDEIQENASRGLTKSILDKMSYLRACIKESLRLKPPMPLLSRVLNKDIVVHNYRIPKGTYMLIATHLASLREEYFEDAEKFKPERWLDPNLDKSIIQFATIPYGYGPKACIARELAEMEIGQLIVKVLQKFRIEYYYGDIASNNKLISMPSRPLKFRFANRA